MKHSFIINPAAGKGTHMPALETKIRQVCRQRELNFEILISNAPGQCESLARQVAERGEPCRIYACGGDGTLNEVINGMAYYPNARVTHFPTGSGNDFIKASSDPAAFRDLERLLDAEEAEFDLIRVADRLCADICSIGVDARIAHDMVKYKHLPLVSGSAAYNLSLVVNVLKGVHQHYIINIDGHRIDARQTLVCACNGRWYGGGYNPVPEAELDDGMMDVLLVKKVSRLQIASIVGQYKIGNYRNYPKLIRHFRVKEFSVRADKPTVVNIDGESLLERDVTICIADEKLRFFYPRGLVWTPKKSPEETKIPAEL